MLPSLTPISCPWLLTVYLVPILFFLGWGSLSLFLAQVRTPQFDIGPLAMSAVDMEPHHHPIVRFPRLLEISEFTHHRTLKLFNTKGPHRRNCEGTWSDECRGQWSSYRFLWLQLS